MNLLATTTLSSSTSSVSFSAIPGTFDDLYLVVSGKVTDTSASDGQGVLFCRFNGQDYTLSRIHLYGTGTSVFAGGTASATNRFLVSGLVNSRSGYTPNIFSSVEAYIPNYTSNTNKTISSTAANEGNVTNPVYLDIGSAVLPLTSAINSLEFYSTSDFAAGSSFYLYGIKK